MQAAESNKWHRGGFLSSLNRSFRLSNGKTKSVESKTVNMQNLPTETGLNTSNDASSVLRPLEIVAPRIDTYRFSMANLAETQDADLDAILGELCALDSEYDEELSRVNAGYGSVKESRDSTTEVNQQVKECIDVNSTITRTDSPDNDSAFSDTVSMLSSESSASSSTSAKALKLNLHQNQKDASMQQKADKIKLALERMREANVKKLFIKAFSVDGSSKSLLVDEKMSCGYVTRLLADKNHVTMEPKWAIVEHLPDLHMERVYEDHEMLVDNLMSWTRESKNKIFFAERPDKIELFQTPEKFLLSEDDRGWSKEHDDHSRQVIIEEFFGQSGESTCVPSVSGHAVPPIEGPLYLKSDVKKGWKRYHFVLRPSGLYYSPKDKVKTLKELVCLATFDNNEVYLGVNWKKKYKSPTDYCFAIKHPRLQQPKSVKFIKFLCADDQKTLERWVTAMRIAKHGRQLLENHRSLVEELTQEDIDHLAHARSCSITSIPTKSHGSGVAGVSSPVQSTSSNVSVVNSDISSGRHSRASSSSSSGCLSDGGTASESGFDCEFPMGTIKRKPSMKPNIPLTWMTRQLMEMAEVEDTGPGRDDGTLTRRSRQARDNTLTRHSRSTDSESVIYGGTSSVVSSNGSPARRESTSPAYSFRSESIYSYGKAEYSSLYSCGVEEELPPPPPPPADDLFSSTLSLQSLPPPPDDLPPPLSPPSLHAPPPPAPTTAPSPSPSPSPSPISAPTPKKVIFADETPRPRIVPFEITTSPRKPPPPKRNESTRLSSPRKLNEPPKEFLKDLQRVMRKKWQVAQKCKLEPATTPHEVLGFREYPLSDEYKETSVSMWVHEHYGAGGGAGAGGGGAGGGTRRPPPAPPRRSDSTHLTTLAPLAEHPLHPTA